MMCFKAYNIKELMFVLTVLVSVLCESQTRKLDSVLKVIENCKVVDTSFINLRNEFGKAKLIVTPKDSTLLKFQLKTLEYSKEVNYLKGEIESYIEIAKVYQYVFSNPYKALDYCHKVIELCGDNILFKDKKLSMYTNIGVIFHGLGEYKKSLTYHKRYYAFRPNDINVLCNIAGAYGGLLQLDSSMHYYKKAVKIGKKSNSKIYLANALNNLSLVLNKTNKVDEALVSIEESLYLVEKYNLNIIKAHSYKAAADIYFKKNDFDKAEKYALNALESTKSINYLYIKKSVWSTLSNIYEAKKNYPKAFEFIKKYNVLKDSLMGNDRKLEISRKEIKFEADKKELIALQEVKRQKLLRNTFLYAGSIILLALIIGFVLYRRKQSAVVKAKEAQFKTKVADTELKVLRAQINPHFIFNSLNSIGSYIASNNNEAANNYLTKFSKLMRQTLESSEKEEISLKEDLELLNNYLEIEKKRFSSGFNHKIIVDDELDTENILVPPMILQPFVENSIWHGISKLEKNGFIEINVKKHDNKIIYSVDDNGVGRLKPNEEKTPHKKALGIKITKNRIDIINQRKGFDANLKIIDKEQGTKVEIYLPLTKAFNDD